jgi:hypothetical protein
MTSMQHKAAIAHFLKNGRCHYMHFLVHFPSGTMLNNSVFGRDGQLKKEVIYLKHCLTSSDGSKGFDVYGLCSLGANKPVTDVAANFLANTSRNIVVCTRYYVRPSICCLYRASYVSLASPGSSRCCHACWSCRFVDLVPQSVRPLAILSFNRFSESFIEHGRQLFTGLEVAFGKLCAKSACGPFQLRKLVECCFYAASLHSQTSVVAFRNHVLET